MNPINFAAFLAGLFIAGHLYWGPRWALDGTRDIWQQWARIGRAVARVVRRA